MMSQVDPSLSSGGGSGTGWQILAALDLRAGEGSESQVRVWMSETLGLLELHQELLDRIVHSALEAIEREKQAGGAELKSPLVGLRLYTPPQNARRSASRRNWGFFRIEKVGFLSRGNDRIDHLIEFFLYQDG